MKINLHLTLFFLFLISRTYAQAPQSINYQAVIRNDAGVVVPNKTINLRFSIQEGIATTPQYIEVQQAITNSVGLVTLAIGKGTAQSGTFAGINWSLGTKFLKIEVDINGGNNFALIGTQQFLSVPFALYAERAGNSTAPGWGMNSNALTGTESLGSNNNQPLLFKTNNIERARITEGGRIGLGTTTPSGWLSIVTKGDGQSSVEDRISMLLNNTSTSSASSANIHMTAGGSSSLTALTHHAPNYSVVNGYSNFGQLASTGPGLILQAKNGILRFETGDNGNGVFERMRITNEGRVGMGIANPEAWLSINAKGDGLSNVEDRTFLSLNNTSTSRASNASLKITAGNDGYFTILNHHSSTYSVVNNADTYGQLWNSGKGLIIRASPTSAQTNQNGVIKFLTGYNPADILDNYLSYERMRITSDGKIGIGTNAPSAQFHTTSSVRLAGLTQNNQLTQIVSMDAQGNLAWRDASTLTSSGSGSGWGLNGNALSGSESIGSSNSQPLIFKTNNTEKIRITEGGRVGMGTTAPKGWLSVEAKGDGLSSVEDRILFSINNTSSSNASIAAAHFTAGGTSTITALAHLSPTYSVVPGYADYGQLVSTGPGLTIQARTGVLRFETGVRSDGGVIERLRISNDGNIGIGTTLPKSKVQVTGGDVYISDITKGVIMKSPNGNCFRITVADNGTLVTTAITCPN